jgi:hypothetical protein
MTHEFGAVFKGLEEYRAFSIPSVPSRKREKGSPALGSVDSLTNNREFSIL